MTTLQPGQSDKFNREIVTVKEAQERLKSHYYTLAKEWVPLEESQGRWLAERISSPHPYPHFRRSAMDGYALLAQDTEGASGDQPVWLQVIDEIPCGTVSSLKVEPGTAMRIMTGAQVPEGADTVIMLEKTIQKTENGSVWVGIQEACKSDKNITPIGFELKEGELLLEAGIEITAGVISVLATFGYHQVPVYKRPKVAIFATGSELLSIDEPIQPGKIRNSNSYMLQAQVREAGAVPILLEAIHDDLKLAQAKVEEALKQYDMVITSGGVSVGDYDIMGDLVRSEGVQMLYNKVAMRPGSVTTAAVKEGKLLFALSGNPGACFVGFELFVRPTILSMMGSPEPYLQEWTAVMGQDYKRMNSFTRFVRGRTEVVDGTVKVYPAGIDESGVMITIKDSDCLIVIPGGTDKIAAGERVTVIKLK